VGVPVIALLAILQAGRTLSAPLSVGGDWALDSAPTADCANPPGSLQRQLVWSISQSGARARVTLHDGYGTTFDAHIDGATFNGKSPRGSVAATIAGPLDSRTMEGKVTLDGCAPVAFHAVRQPSKARNE
jgi:hypothetical protein